MKAAFPLIAVMMLVGCDREPAPLVTVNDARVIATPTSAAAYFTLANGGGDDRLLSVDAPGVGKAGLHETSMAGGIMRMRALTGGIAIPANGRVMLTPSGRHVMIQDLKQPLSAGSSITLVLKFERQGVVKVDAAVGGMR